ncbi:hypothetical protein PSAC2689_30277 [Paraburkholderia sacchari]
MSKAARGKQREKRVERLFDGELCARIAGNGGAGVRVLAALQEELLADFEVGAQIRRAFPGDVARAGRGKQDDDRKCEFFKQLETVRHG